MKKPSLLSDPELRSHYSNGRCRPITKAQSKEFARRVTELMERRKLGQFAKPPPFGVAHWIIPARFSDFEITVPDKQYSLFTVFTRFGFTSLNWRGFFENFTGPNPYSGKWNVHQLYANRALEQLEYQLDKALSKENESF